MNKKGKVILAVGALVSGVGVLLSEIKNRNRIAVVEQEMKELMALNEAMILLQDDCNEAIEERFEEVVDEIASVYMHLEALADERVDG